MSHGKNFVSLPSGLGGEARKLLDYHQHAVTAIDSLHRLVHDGMVFNATGKVATLANGATDVFLMSVPAGVYPHMNRATFNFGLGDVDVVTRKDVVTSADGSVVAAPNTNQNSSNTAQMVLTSAPTITDAGTVLHTTWATPTATGTGIHTNTGISGVTPGEEWVMEANTKYSMSITNNSGSTIAYSYDLLFYEVSYVE